jgi:hypothetical protein
MRTWLGIAAAAFAWLFLASPSVAYSQAAEATVICKDGTTSEGGKGACSGHGGVDQTGAKPGAKAPSGGSAKQGGTGTAASATATPKNTDPTGAIARCKDGTYSHAKSHSGACSHHGGVGQWMDQPAK